MIYLSAGHNPGGLKPDPGAVGNGFREADLTKELRDIAVAVMREKGVPVWIDDDTQRLPDVLKAIASTEKDVVCDLHFNAGPPAATGCETFIPTRHTTLEMSVASKINDTIRNITSLRNRGVRTEADSQHGSLGIMRENGINLLVEVCFISNATDMQRYQMNKVNIGMALAEILINADNLIK